MELSLSGIARITGKSERTIARWIQNRQIAATRLGNGMYDVDEQALTRLRPQDENTLVLIHLEEIAARLDALEAGQARLEQGLEAIQTMLSTRPFKQIAARQSSAPVLTSQHTENVTQADGLEIATVFATRHFPAMSGEQIGRMCQTLRENGSVPMIEGKYQVGKAPAKYALDAAGREAFYQVTHERDGFQPCLECPHEPAQEE